MMMIPEAWEQHSTMDERRRAFYEYHAAMMEPWDGPASMVFTDGRQIGATLDRNGLRPCALSSSPMTTWSCMASESGVLPIPENKIVKKWRLQPGKMFLIDLEQGRIIEDEELKAQYIVKAKPYRQWIENAAHQAGQHRSRCGRCGPSETADLPLLDRQQAFGYTQEDIKFLMAPMAKNGEEGIGSMGNDTPAGRAVGQEQAAVQLLQAAVRPGDEPADRPDPRSDRDVAQSSFVAPSPTCWTSTRSTRPCASKSASLC